MSVTIPASDHSPITRSRAVVDHVVPTGREEEWRFTPLARLGGLHLGTVDLSAPLDINVTAEGFVSASSAMMAAISSMRLLVVSLSPP